GRRRRRASTPSGSPRRSRRSSVAFAAASRRATVSTWCCRCRGRRKGSWPWEDSFGLRLRGRAGGTLPRAFPTSDERTRPSGTGILENLPVAAESVLRCPVPWPCGVQQAWRKCALLSGQARAESRILDSEGAGEEKLAVFFADGMKYVDDA